MCGSVKLWNKLILKCKVDGMYAKVWGAWYGKGWPFFVAVKVCTLYLEEVVHASR